MFGSGGASGPNSESLAEVIRANRMSTRPAYTSGRPAQVCDLQPKALEAIWEHLGTDEFPEFAQKSFVDLVEAIEVMSATKFLNGLYDLERNGWVFESSEQPSGAAIDAHGAARDVQAFMTIAETMFSNDRDETGAIKNGFLIRHGRAAKGCVGYRMEPHCFDDERDVDCYDRNGPKRKSWP